MGVAMKRIGVILLVAFVALTDIWLDTFGIDAFSRTFWLAIIWVFGVLFVPGMALALIWFDAPSVFARFRAFREAHVHVLGVFIVARFAFARVGAYTLTVNAESIENQQDD